MIYSKFNFTEGGSMQYQVDDIEASPKLLLHAAQLLTAGRRAFKKIAKMPTTVKLD